MSSFLPGLGPVRDDHPGVAEQRQAARLVVCEHARDATDAERLLDILGLLPERTEDPR